MSLLKKLLQRLFSKKYPQKISIRIIIALFLDSSITIYFGAMIIRMEIFFHPRGKYATQRKKRCGNFIEIWNPIYLEPNGK